LLNYFDKGKINQMSKSAKAPQPAPSDRIRQKRARARREILAAARELLLAGGVDAVTLAAVAARLDLTKQALYHYFPSKETLLKALIASLLEEEIDAILAAVDRTGPGGDVLGVMVKAFYDHYIHALEAFRAIYCQSQLLPAATMGLDEDTLRETINPQTRRLFDLLEQRLTAKGMSKPERRQKRRLAYSAWLSALGLLTMLSVTEAAGDPLIYSDRELLDTLKGVFNDAAQA